MTSGTPTTETEFGDFLVQRTEHKLQSKGYATVPYEDTAWESHATTCRTICTVITLPKNAQEREKTGETTAEQFLSCGCLEEPGHYDLVSVGFALGLGPDAQYNTGDNFARLMIKTSHRTSKNSPLPFAEMIFDADTKIMEFGGLLTQHVEHELKSKGYAMIPYEDAAWESCPITRTETSYTLPENAQTREKIIEGSAEALLSQYLEEPGHYDLVGVGFVLGKGEAAQYNPPDYWGRLMIKTSP